MSADSIRHRFRTARWVLLAFAVIVAVSVVTVYLTAPRPGGALDPESTSPEHRTTATSTPSTIGSLP